MTPAPASLPVHRRLIAGNVDTFAALAGHVCREINRKAEGVVKRKHGIAIEHVAFARQRGIEDLHAVFQRLGEALFLGQQRLFYPLGLRSECGVGSAHHEHQVVDESVEKRFGLAEFVAVSQGAADDPPQNVTTPVVRRNHAIDNQEGAGTNVVGNHLERRLR